jgi:hypothetical protein
MATSTMQAPSRQPSSASRHEGHVSRPSDSSARQHAEGPVAKAIEQQTAKLPSDLFLWAAGAAMVTSFALQLMRREHESLFIGQWAPSLLLFGLYNKLVKVAGSDREAATSESR